MRIPTHHDRDELRDDRAMTPMIDVVFLMLIFFVCASIGQIVESLLPTELAAGSIEATEPIEELKPLGEVWLELRRAGGETLAELNDKQYRDFGSLRATLRRLAEVAPEIPVILDIGSEVPMGAAIRAYDTCLEAGFQSIDFAAE